jgi:hypothetical protein
MVIFHSFLYVYQRVTSGKQSEKRNGFQRSAPKIQYDSVVILSDPGCESESTWLAKKI